MATLIGVALVTAITTPIYRAETILQVNAAVIRPQDMDPFSGLFLSREAVASMIELTRTPMILDQVIANLDLASSGTDLGKLKVEQVGKVEFFKITIDHPDPALARNIANEIARVIRAESKREWQDRIATSQALLNIRLANLQQQITDTRQAIAASNGDTQILALQLGQYETQYAEALRSLEESQFASSQIDDVLMVRAYATIPGVPISPNPILNLILGLMLGSVLAAGLVSFVEYLDNRIKSPEQVRRLLGVPVMGALPIMASDRDAARALTLNSEEDDVALEPFHLLRTNLQFSWADKASQTLLVTSAEIGEGKTTILANLGVALAAVGMRVILIDADLRRPQVHKMFGLPLSDGLSNLLTSDNPDMQAYLQHTTIPNLSVLSGGARPSNPSVLLGSERMRSLLSEAKGMANVVLVDTPPVLYSSDSLVLVAAVNQVLLVIGSGMLRSATVQRAREALGMVRAQKVDVVLNRVRRDTDAYAYYSYYYYNYHHDRDSR